MKSAEETNAPTSLFARPQWRMASVTAVISLIATLLIACGASREDAAEVAFQTEASGPVVLDDADPSAASIGASQQLFAASEVAFVATEDGVSDLADNATELRVPLLVTGDGVAAELERLGVSQVIHAESHDVTDLGVATLPVNPDAASADMGLPALEITQDAAPAVLFTDDSTESPAAMAAAANVAAAAGTTATMAGGDPRASGETVAAAREHAAGTVLAIGSSFGDSDQFAARFTTAATAPELPGGGQLPFANRLMVAAYGHPGSPVLGVLGEGDLDAAVTTAKELAAEYEELTDRTVVPTFELITTIASASPTDDGDYSAETPIEDLRPWVDRAGEEGIYVVLDLQPGTTSFLEQAKRYEELLAYPHVGLALDPEWRLEPGQKHMVQIGSVEIDVVNETIAWLAEFTSEHGLPPKVLVLHQFTLSMIQDRDQLDTSHDDIALLVHVDGHGAPGDKMATWNTLREDLPEGVSLGWKNFIDEDSPMFTPEETLAVEPTPLFVSYQ